MTAATPAAGRSDEELMRALAAGDPAPVGTLYLRYGKMLFSVLHRYASWLTEAEMEDVCQDVFVTLHDKARGYQERGRLRSYLCGIAIRKAKNLRRTRWLRDNILQRAFGRRERTQPSAHAALETQDALDKAVQAISPGLREVLLLHVIEELSAEEIAEALGIAVGAVWVRLHRARRAVEAALEEEP